MSFESSSYDCQNQMYGVDFSDYPPVHQDANISISAVVSASCVVVNDHPQHHDDSFSQYHFPPASIVDTAFEGPANGNQCLVEDSFCTMVRRQDFDDGDYNQNVCSNFTEQVPFSNLVQQPYFTHHHETNPESMELRGNSFQDTHAYDCYETAMTTGYAQTAMTTGYAQTAMTTGYAQKDQTSDFCGRNSLTYDPSAFDSTNIYPQSSTPVSSCESFFPESSPGADFESTPCQENAKATLDKTGRNAQTSCVDINVDEMIGSGVTVAGFKPRAIIRKRKKSKTPCDAKDGCYWSKRVKNNDSARRSRETKKDKERNFYKRALELEYENFYLKEKISHLESQLSAFSADGNSSLGDSFV